MARTIKIDNSVTVGGLAEKLEMPVSTVISELMKNGVLATVNERIDFDTASIIVSEIDPEVTLELREHRNETARTRTKVKEGDPRPPVVAVMGHVDHGKTSLLDAICGSKVTSGEAGGITQHISASQVVHNDRAITFLDTPGHEAFAAIREHGAMLTDIVVLVVAADDGIKPQTLEAIRFAQKAGVKIVVAANKMDKEGADINKLYSQLSEHGMVWDGWKGGDTPVVPVSAKTKEGISDLLDMILLITDVEDLRSPTDVPAKGLIIEAHMEQGRGPVAVALIELGILKKSSFLVAGSTYAKVRNLEGADGKPISEAGPSTPVVLSGFKSLPRFGDEFYVVEDEKTARMQSTSNSEQSHNQNKQDMTGGDLIRIIDKKRQTKELNVIIKADVQGSLKSVIDSLRSLNTDEVAVRLVGSGVGEITEKDVHLASTSQALVYGFNISVGNTAKHVAQRSGVSLRMFDVIYELIDDCKNELSGLLTDEIVRSDIGRLVVKGIFKIAKDEIICGGEVTKGKLLVPANVDIYRGDNLIASALATKLQRGPQEAKEVQSGEMCGVSLVTEARIDIQEGDRMEFYQEETITRTL